ncbi:serine aminopeptidase domain-containing protein [Micromonospora radicis]|uniref:Alpha/beta fold hydrolase n=1 Tax=Micromonospora radicis TaxID=1894971 RepID=A0A418MN56_9ACTN|nr:alpha/beta hydrolase [Micromonospora radicis]RIV31605.1 alpha/beta fold hydrolase [Micromonospora radicis]
MRFLKLAGIGVSALLGMVLVAVVALYVWPLDSDRLSAGRPETLDFAAAVGRAESAVQADTADAEVLPECRTGLYSHGRPTAKVVLMLHGYRDCPAQYAGLARLFFDRGYNVYIPREPLHGVRDGDASSEVQADNLVGYADEALNIAAGLGVEVGVVGLSGGGVLATWLAQHRSDVVTRLLVLSPFYRPASAQAPGFLIRPLTVLYGFRLLPDRVNANRFSFAALTQYLRIAQIYRDAPRSDRLRSVSVVLSPNDTFIDADEARRVTRNLAETNGLAARVFDLPAEFGIGHDLVAPEEVGDRAAELYSSYLALYEGSTTPAGR